MQTIWETVAEHGLFACGSLGYAFSDAIHAGKVVVITDNLVPYPLKDTSINEGYVDYVVQVEQIGDPARIVSGTTKITRDPVGLRIAGLAAQVVKHSGYLKDGFSSSRPVPEALPWLWQNMWKK